MPRPGSATWRRSPMCRRSQSSALVLANGADSCSNYLPIGRTSCSHCPPLCLPTERRARQQRILLILAANKQNRRKRQENIWWRCVQRCYPPFAFSKFVNWLAFRNAAIQNSFENGHEVRSPLWPWRGRDRQKPRLSRTASRLPNAQTVIGSDCEHEAPLASTARRWRAQWQIM
jgi:hypothetical protein